MKRLITIILLLLSGLIIYWLFRPGIFFFKMAGIYNSNVITIPVTQISILVKNYLPDFLWVIALYNTAILLKEQKVAIVYINSLIVLPFLSEVLQNFQVIPGTFDWYDLLVYLLAYIFCFKSKIIHLCKTNSENLLARWYF